MVGERCLFTVLQRMFLGLHRFLSDHLNCQPSAKQGLCGWIWKPRPREQAKNDAVLTDEDFL